MSRMVSWIVLREGWCCLFAYFIARSWSTWKIRPIPPIPIGEDYAAMPCSAARAEDHPPGWLDLDRVHQGRVPEQSRLPRYGYSRPRFSGPGEGAGGVALKRGSFNAFSQEDVQYAGNDCFHQVYRKTCDLRPGIFCHLRWWQHCRARAATAVP